MALLFSSPQFKSLYRQTMPMLVGLFAIMGSQLVDSAFIGQLGEKPLAVVGFSLPVYQLIIGFQVGIGIATTACISIALGENKQLYAKHLGAIIFVIGTTTISLLCWLLWFYQENIASALGAQSSLLMLLRSYWLPWLFSCWLGALLYLGYSLCRSHGETLIPGKVMVITSLLNVVLDPLLIFGFEMGLAGAAWATNLSFIVGLFILFSAIKTKNFIVVPYDLKLVAQSTQLVLKFTAPATVSQFIPPISAMLVTIMVASFGNFAVGAWGLANRIEYLSIILILAITMALPPMVGKLKGQGDYQEIFKLIKTAIQFIIVFQLILAISLIIIASPLATIFSNQSEVTLLLKQYLWFVPISYGALGVCMVSVSAASAIGLPTPALRISILRLFVCYLPFVWLGSQLYGLIGLFAGACLGNLLSGVVGWQLFMTQLNEAKHQYKEINVF